MCPIGKEKGQEDKGSPQEQVLSTEAPVKSMHAKQGLYLYGSTSHLRRLSL
jgi:hypothetical protein